MASIKTTHNVLAALANRKLPTRKKPVPAEPAAIQKETKAMRIKRKAENSPLKETKANSKRMAFGDRNLNVGSIKEKVTDPKQKKELPVKKPTVQSKTVMSVKTVLKSKQNENIPPAPGNKVLKRGAVKNIVVPNQTAIKPKEVLKEKNSDNKANKEQMAKRLSNEFEKTDESLYSTALEDCAKKLSLRSSKSSSRKPSSCNSEDGKVEEESLSFTSVVNQLEKKLTLVEYQVPDGVEDFDKENWDDIFQVSHYAMDIFNYLKSREPQFEIADYMDKQICLNQWMRSLLVDWMVEIQESFELNHETLYLGIKLVDMYLSKVVVGKETLQLVGAAAMFVASKYDERVPPMIADFLYICDGAYVKQELQRMEINLLKVCDFNLGIPISYRFLRRYARCGKVTMPILTLARFILEFSLMDYRTISVRDSKLASAALYLALKMKKVSGWTPALEYYTGYKLDEFKDIVTLLNDGLHTPPKSQLMTVRNKYSHKIFFQVARTPLISNEDLWK